MFQELNQIITSSIKCVDNKIVRPVCMVRETHTITRPRTHTSHAHAHSPNTHGSKERVRISRPVLLLLGTEHLAACSHVSNWCKTYSNLNRSWFDWLREKTTFKKIQKSKIKPFENSKIIEIIIQHERISYNMCVGKPNCTCKYLHVRECLKIERL